MLFTWPDHPRSLTIILAPPPSSSAEAEDPAFRLTCSNSWILRLREG